MGTAPACSGSARWSAPSGTGTTLYHLPPGELLCPYHYEYGEEEWLLVLSGRPFLRTPSGTEELEADGRGLLPARAGGRPPGRQPDATSRRAS